MARLAHRGTTGTNGRPTVTDHTVPCVEGDWPGCIPSCGADHDGHTVNGPVTVGITGEVDPDRLLRLYAAEVDRLRAEVLKHGDHTPACRYRRAEGDGRHCLPSCGWDTSDHDGHTIDAGPVTVGTCGCSNNFGHTCEEVARLRADNATMRDLLAKALPWIDPNDSHDDYLLTVAIREALGEET